VSKIFRRIVTAATVCILSLAVGAGLGAMGVSVRLPATDDVSLMRRGDIVLMFIPIVWIITTLLIGQALPKRPRAVMISGVVRKRTVVTDQLRLAIVAAYIGDGQPGIREVAARMKCSYGTVHRIVADAGVMRPRGLTKIARQRKIQRRAATA
jgi:hypothetical protein